MKKEEFLRELEALLGDISQGEREEAIQYYRDYFDDAGPEKEADIMEELGSPIRVARIIKAGLGDNDGEFSEQGYRDQRFVRGQELGRRTKEDEDNGRSQSQENTWQAPPSSNGWKIACIILLCILLLPVIFPVGVGILVVTLAIPMVVLAVGVAIAASSLAVLISGIATIATGLVNLFFIPPVGIALVGVGFLVLALGILMTLATICCCWKVIPWMIRGIVQVFSYPIRKRREAGQA